ncbi:hypothetical protein H5410_004788 [Solanum commersonii]|uniref:Uncharacterized protein n=1 Tax=Solanum commersonii TaxID=4109 RepID=A0A9J6A5B7_SOLCO|nr:hypothetical protein H5410_004788 [Solanum commersonii]
MALLRNREDTVYTLVLTILEHYNGRFTNHYEAVRTLLNGLRCRHLGEFRWYKDTYMSRVMELPENRLKHWKTKFIDGLPHLFAERVRKILRNNKGKIPYNTYTYGKLIGVCTQEGDLCTQFGLPDTSANSKKKKHRDSRESNPDKPYRKKRSRHRFKEEREDRRGFFHIAPNCKLEKLKTLELDEEIHDKSDYDSDSGSVEEIELLDNSDNNQPTNMNTCNACYVNNNASSSKNVEKQKNYFEFEYFAPYSLSEVNNRHNKQPTSTRDSSFDDLKIEVENF